jgi:hypothetical protein
MRVSEAPDTGSIPVEATFYKFEEVESRKQPGKDRFYETIILI